MSDVAERISEDRIRARQSREDTNLFSRLPAVYAASRTQGQRCLQHGGGLSIVEWRTLRDLAEAFRALPEWTVAALEPAFAAVVDKHGLKMGKVAQPLRVAVTGSTASPGIFETVFLVGRDRTLERLATAASMASGGENPA